MKGNFNKSISMMKHGHYNVKGDKSALLDERSGFGLGNQAMDRS